jgi:hypothetical protein
VNSETKNFASKKVHATNFLKYTGGVIQELNVAERGQSKCLEL